MLVTVVVVLALAVLLLLGALWFLWQQQQNQQRANTQREVEQQAALQGAMVRVAVGDAALADLASARAATSAAVNAQHLAEQALSACQSQCSALTAAAEAGEKARVLAQGQFREIQEQLASELANVRQSLEKSSELRAQLESRASAAEARLVACQLSQQELVARCDEQNRRLEAAQSAATTREALVATLQGELAQHVAVAEERERGHAEQRSQLATQLRALTQQLYEEQGKAFLGEGRAQLAATLVPFRERLEGMQARMDQIHSSDLQDRAALQNELKSMVAAQVRLSSEAEQLGRALRADSKAQGAWGELTLHRLLEASQLERGLTYELQVSVRAEDGTQGRPDAVIFLPEQKCLAIDAKVSLTAFIRATNASTDAERNLALAEHLTSVRQHIRGLADRDYPEAIKDALKGHSLDLTLLFLPSEAAFAAALTQDSELWAEALNKRIIIVSPTTLLATLRVVAQLWRVEKQNRNAADIAKEAGKMVEKLRGALDDLDSVARSLATASKTFDEARSKLTSGRGNVLRRASNLIALGAPAKDDIKQRLRSDADDDMDEPVQKAIP